MIRTRPLTAVSAILTMMLLGCGGNTSAVDLKLSLKQGETYRTRIVTDQTINHNVNGQSTRVKQKTTQDLACEVIEIDSDGNYIMRVTFERIAEEMERGTVRQAYDSDQPGDKNSIYAKKFGPFVGHSITLVVSGGGEMVGTSGIDSLVDRIIVALDMKVDTLRDQMRTLLQGEYSRQIAQEICDNLFGVLPGGPVSVGESWNCSTEGKILIPIKWEHSLSILSIDDGISVLADTATTKLELQDEPEDMGPVKINREAEGSQNGTLEIDTATGLIVGGSVTASIKGQQHIVEGPQQLKGKSIPLDVVQTMTWQKL